MKKTAVRSVTNANSANTSQAIKTLHFGEFVGIGWRIALPVIAFVTLGAICDARFGTKPWLTLSGVVVGFLLAGLLVKRQVGGTEAADKKRQG